MTFLFVSFAWPGEALAWGPLTHLAHGSAVLKGLSILALPLQQLLKRHRRQYLYGCVGADIIQAKNYSRTEQAHCHSWEVGWALLDRAKNNPQRAFAYGYLTHLAGDVYSHNHYVPTQLVISFDARALRHIYWEACFDTLQDDGLRKIVRELRDIELPECDQLVNTVISRTLFSFTTDKRIFDSFIAIHDLDQWHKIMQRLSQVSRYTLDPQIVAEYNQVCIASIFDLLQEGRESACQKADPTGAFAIEKAQLLRESLKQLQSQPGMTDQIRRQIDAMNERRLLIRK